MASKDISFTDFMMEGLVELLESMMTDGTVNWNVSKVANIVGNMLSNMLSSMLTKMLNQTLLCVLFAASAASALSLPRARREVSSADQRADPSLLLYSSAVPSAVGLAGLPLVQSPLVQSPLIWRRKRDVGAAEMDQQADPALLVYSSLPISSSIYSPFLWRKKRDIDTGERKRPCRILYRMPLGSDLLADNAFMMPLL
ncbi:hypothetical protein FJT64_003079 [Amphibalanus amphitrite]|uniref:Uncharacterized protein n=1 Tax=Amphibalanus amphitrite TaxID=1232801 RepID=A0A6A4WDT6_AMPAM|nr:hypothetical protein FJT64_003079 [Amphibalanus amphitrite]